MNKSQKFILIFIGICMFAVLVVISFNLLMPKPEITPDDISVKERTLQEEPVVKKEEIKENEFVNIFFIGKNNKGEEVYKAVKRAYEPRLDGSKIKFAVNELLQGPNTVERSFGVYTEIPSGVRLINIINQGDKIIVNLNSTFVNEGGSESLYKRLYQLIKTVNLNSDLPVYLYIDGQMADIVGGEGIMISQPLKGTSLGN